MQKLSLGPLQALISRVSKEDVAASIALDAAGLDGLLRAPETAIVKEGGGGGTRLQRTRPDAVGQLHIASPPLAEQALIMCCMRSQQRRQQHRLQARCLGAWVIPMCNSPVQQPSACGAREKTSEVASDPALGTRLIRSCINHAHQHQLGVERRLQRLRG